MFENTQYHRPVLYQEIISALQPISGGKYIDCTLGAGGHSRGILEASAPDGELLAFDLDATAIKIASQTVEPFKNRIHLRHESYLHMHEVMQELGWEAVDGILLDYGVSSMQLDQPDRGFSFRKDGPLDMRFDTRQGISAATYLNQVDEETLADVLWRFGEESRSRRIAAAIIANRPIETTQQLAQIIEKAIGRSQKRGTKSIHPATKSFQAIRIAVNQELDAVERSLPLALKALKSGGVLAVITFHSLEDRLVKNFMRDESKDCLCPPEQWTCTCGHQATLTRITTKPIIAAPAEIEQNPRARSAKLRIAKRL